MISDKELNMNKISITMKKIVFNIFFIIFTTAAITAQNSHKKVGFGFSYGFGDFAGPNNGSFYKPDFLNSTIGPTHFNFTVNLFKPLNISASYNMMRLNKYPDLILTNLYWRANLGLQFRFIAPFVNDDSWFDPYIYGSGGFININAQNKNNISAGIGLNIWIGKVVALNIESGYNYGFGYERSYYSSVGIKFRFGKKKVSTIDTDGDGIPDEDDLCPDEPGIADRAGCPALTRGEKRRINRSLNKNAENIKFERADVGIVDTCKIYLDNIANTLKRHTSLKISIECHTDTTGYESFNITLSQERAQAVKKYIVDKGVENSRIRSKGFGSSVPRADNKTILGRAKNRRVEIKLLK